MDEITGEMTFHPDEARPYRVTVKRNGVTVASQDAETLSDAALILDRMLTTIKGAARRDPP